MEESSDSYSLPSYERNFSTFSSAAPVFKYSNPDRDRHSDLITFLSTLQERDIDILPITWQPTLEDLGRGGTGVVNQSLLTAKASFAFKRIGSSAKGLSVEDRADAYRALIS